MRVVIVRGRNKLQRAQQGRLLMLPSGCHACLASPNFSIVVYCLPHQPSVADIVPGGAADLDGRLQVGDEITHVNGHSVIDAPHHNVISAMGEALAQGEVVLNICRNMPVPGEGSTVVA